MVEAKLLLTIAALLVVLGSICAAMAAWEYGKTVLHVEGTVSQAASFTNATVTMDLFAGETREEEVTIEGTVPEQSQVVFYLADAENISKLEEFWVDVYLGEALAGRVAVGSNATCIMAAGTYTFTLHVHAKAPEELEEQFAWSAEVAVHVEPYTG